MTGLLHRLLKPFLPMIERCTQHPPLPDPEPDDSYREAMEQALAARRRAEEIVAACSERKSSTRPA